MPAPEIKTGDFELTFGDSELEKCVSQIRLSLALDEPSELTFSIALNAQEASQFKSSVPQSASFKWAGKTLFQGSICGVVPQDNHCLKLSFKDKLFTAHQIIENGFMKKQTLQDCIKKLCSKIGLTARYEGSFSMEVPVFNLGDQSVFFHLRKLGDLYGFHFFSKPGSQNVYFIKVGESTRRLSIDCQKDICQHGSHLNAGETFQSATIKYFDPSTLEPSEKKMNANQLYNQLGSLKSHSTFNEKMKWESSEGQIQTSTTDKYHFDSGEALMKARLSKKLLSQERVHLKCFSPLGMPGEIVSLSKTSFPNIQDGSYLIESCNLDISSALPQMEITAIRP